jgi:carbonic anhydrase
VIQISNDFNRYRIEQFHFHAPSDHKIDGKSFDLELHIVTRSHDSKNLSVFSLLFNAGTKVNEFFSDFLSSPLPTNGAESEKDISTVLFQAELQKALFDGYFYYEGSLTIPPCTEQVQWHICATPLTALQSQIDAISKAKGVSSRPVQQLNGRVVSKYSLSNAAGYNGVSWMLAGFAVMMSIFFCVFCICL